MSTRKNAPWVKVTPNRPSSSSSPTSPKTAAQPYPGPRTTDNDRLRPSEQRQGAADTQVWYRLVPFNEELPFTVGKDPVPPTDVAANPVEHVFEVLCRVQLQELLIVGVG